jgi:hypothetical protein
MDVWKIYVCRFENEGKPDPHIHNSFTIRSPRISFWLIGRGRLMHKRISLPCIEREIYLASAALSLGKVLENILGILLLTGRSWLKITPTGGPCN